MPKYIVKCIPKAEAAAWVDTLVAGTSCLPLWAAKPFSHAIVVHGDRALVLEVARRVRAPGIVMCGSKLKRPVRANMKLYFKPAKVAKVQYQAAKTGFQGIRYCDLASVYAVGAP